MAKLTKRTIARAERAQRDAMRLVRDGKAGKVADAAKDSFQNFALNLGIGTDNALSYSTYGFNPVTRNRTLLEWIYRGSWIGGKAIDTAADDMTRGGIDIQADLDPKAVETINKAAVSCGVWSGLADTIRWARLYGGAIGVFLIDGQDMRTPLNPERIGRGQFRGIFPLDRWMVEPDLNNLVSEFGPQLGEPAYYRVISDAPGLRGKVIHHSRVFRMEGISLPRWQRVSENLWGISVLERIYDRMVAFDSATQGAAQMCYKMYLRTYKIKNLRGAVSEGGKAEQGIIRQVDFMRRFQGIEGITLIDGEDDFVVNQANLQSGVAEALIQFGQQLAGALETPLVRLFGQSPAGLNSTGESDLITYYDGVKEKQERRMRMPVGTIYTLMGRSEGVPIDAQFNFEFTPLWQLKESERSEVDGRDVDAVTKVEAGGLITQRVALQELRSRGKATNRWSTITDEMIEQADDTLPPSLEEMGLLGTKEGGTEAKELTAEAKEDDAGAQPDKGRKPPTKKAIDRLPFSTVGGLEVAIEHTKGQRRWEGAPVLPADYGYIRRSPSAEGPQEWMDCLVGPHLFSTDAYIFDMYKDGEFDEHKVLLGYQSPGDALKDLAAAYTGLSMRADPVAVPMSTEGVQRWAAAVDITKPARKTADANRRHNGSTQ